MKRFDPNNLSLSNILAFLVPSIILLSIWLWLSQKPYDYDGARGLAVNNAGVVHIQVGTELFRIDRQGNTLPKIDLSELGVVDFVGDLTFNDKDELLLRPGAYQTGFLENFAIFNRESNQHTLEAASGDGLVLCDLNAMQCRPFGGGVHDFNRGFFSVYNQVDGTTVVSDASRHELHKYDVNGLWIASYNKELKFPNEVVFDDNDLFLVDTNNKVVKQFDHADDQFGKLLRSHITANPDSIVNRHDYPFVIEKAGDNWWLIMLDSAMNRGGVYMFDSQWNYIDVLDLGDADLPVGLLSLGNEVLVTDIESNGVLRYSLTGSKLGLFEHAQLNAVLEKNTEQRSFYKILGFAYLTLMALLTVSLFAWAILLQRRSSKSQLAESKEFEPARELVISTIEDTVQWMPGTGLLGSLEKARKVQLICVAFIALAIALSVFYINAYVEEDIVVAAHSKALLWFACACCGLLFLTEEYRVRIGVYQEQLILHDQISDRAFLASGKTVLHDGQRIAFGVFAAKTHHASNRGSELETFVRHVYPLLSTATIINPTTMEMWRYKNARQQAKSYLFKIFLTLLVLGAVLTLEFSPLFT